MPTDHYRTIATPVEFRQKIERSDFHGIAFPIAREEDFFAELDRTAKRHFDATHHCWAFRLFGTGGAPERSPQQRSRSSDAGEPAGTAGRPILSAIEGADLYDLAVIVVRWFGGIKLGTGGLSRAYRDTAAQTLRCAEISDRFVYERFRITAPFEVLGTIYRLVDPPDVLLTKEYFGEPNEFDLDVRRSKADVFAMTLAEKRLRFERLQPPMA